MPSIIIVRKERSLNCIQIKRIGAGNNIINRSTIQNL